MLSIFPPRDMQPTGHPPGTSSANVHRVESSLATISSFSTKSPTETSAAGFGVTPQSSETPDKSTSSSRGSVGTQTIHAVTTTSAPPATRTRAAEGSPPPATTTKAAEGSHGTAPPATTTKATGSSTPETGSGCGK